MNETDSGALNDVIIGIGSNLEPDKHIESALEALKTLFIVEKCSDFVTTAPIGIKDQPDFVNGAVRLRTSRELGEVSSLLKRLEDQLGRDRTRPKYGPREIDLDVVVWNGEVVDKDYYTRSFLKDVVDQIND